MRRFGSILVVLTACSADAPAAPEQPAPARAIGAPTARALERARIATEANRLLLTLAVIDEGITAASVLPEPDLSRRRLAELEAQRRELLRRLAKARAEMPRPPRPLPPAVRISRACLDDPLARGCR